jgi:hypothetical protein
MYHLAQVNIARMLAALDDPIMAGFVARLEDINVLADASPGFVWRLQSDGGDATSIRVYDDPNIIINMSVWESVEALNSFVYRSVHQGVMRHRREWFERFDGPYLALWWIPAGHVPSPAEGKAALDDLRANGPSPRAFAFARPFPPPDGSIVPRAFFDECA